MRLRRPIQTRFRYGYPSRVNLATYRNSQAHSSKGTRSLHSGRSQIAPTACRHTVSGTISRPLTGVLFTFPSRYWFTIGHQGVFRLRRWSSRIHTEFHGLRATWEHARESRGCRVRDCHPLWRNFPRPSASHAIYHSPPARQHWPGGPAPPHAQRLPAITRMRFGLFPFRSPLLRESRLLSLPAGTEMFHFPALPPAALCIQAGATPHDGGRVSPFGNPRITAWLPAPRGLSQAPTSFFGSWYQGIHRVPLKTWLHIHYKNTQRNPPPSEKGHPRRDIGSSRYIDARVHCAVLKKRTAPQAPTPAGVTASGLY